MTKLMVYRQERQDGGIRTGMEVDGLTVLHHFQLGSSDSDPALAWFVDVRAEGRSLPHDPQAAREWFLAQADTIHDGLTQLATDLRAGMDFDAWPLQRSIENAPKGVRLTIACSAVRRVQARDIARTLLDVAKHWSSYLRELEPYHAAIQ